MNELDTSKIDIREYNARNRLAWKVGEPDVDLELVQDCPTFAAELLTQYREERDLLFGALSVIANDETDYPKNLAQNAIEKLLYGEPENDYAKT